ncbi:hypothetical protein E6W36_08865 [Hankyongella ginsenosidimutans]|uniref:Apolipoprotein N-acyltransferase N-terminal domain-containing protein n=1 Tax=Hankyongella ginsenosidimutans TaxID=1763828 RepID=A0A4D7C9J4_9SPHN|nr:hypothetical protein [Hankyongella ginsenosidimutans]QCI79613.1 hypothetical protein E6W36_08865 [Hankyongella ginsenosidimutans]
MAFAGLLWALDGAATRLQAFRLGWWFGFGQFALGLIWIAEAFRFQDALPHSAGYLAVMLLAAFLALFTASSALLTQALAPPGAWRVIALATAWTLGEWLRGHLFTGFPGTSSALPGWPCRRLRRPPGWSGSMVCLS